MVTQRELVQAVRSRYREAAREEKQRILDEFSAITGYHRKYAIRLLKGEAVRPAAVSRFRLYDEAVGQALVILWEAADRVCSKRLKALLPFLIEALERHGHLALDGEVRRRVLAISAASIDRLLQPLRVSAASGRRRRKGLGSAVRRRVPIRTYAEWGDPCPGFMEVDLVEHNGGLVRGSVVQSLTVTDIASGWTECVALLFRNQGLVVEALGVVRERLPFALCGLDSDNDSVFINRVLIDYCETARLDFTRSRPYRKNDQAWVEQKNGAVVRRLVGYERLEGLEATTALAQLYDAARRYVNFFQPSFKLKSKTRDGARVAKQYHPPLTPCERLLASPHLDETAKARLQAERQALDPLQLLQAIRTAQQTLAELSKHCTDPKERVAGDLGAFLAGLATAWQRGESRPTHRRKRMAPRLYRTRADPFAEVWPLVLSWLEAAPHATGKDVFLRLQGEFPGQFEDGQLRTLQRRVSAWRMARARQLIMAGAQTPRTVCLSEPVGA